MLSASIQQANVINHEIQGQRALHPVLLLWQTLQKCHICTFPSFLWPHWLAASQLQPLFFKKKKKRKNIHKYCFTHALLPIYALFDLANMHTNNPDHSFISHSLSAESGKDTPELDIGEHKQSVIAV